MGRGCPGGAVKSVAIVLIAAVADNGVIGRDNALPFRQSSDLRRFKALTIGKPVLMGRKTFASIGKPLPGRTNIVVSRDPGFAPDGVVVVRNLAAAVAAAREDARQRGVDEIAVIGGTGLFAQLMPLADRLEITHVHMRPAGDTHFPPIDATQWRAVARSDHPAGPQDEASFSYVTYARN
ncbi:MAG: dihydrofolate reductase [Xanthobacteraceae bacterium]|nr:dihydrofolate reductase [Xanthobacteraceae bacterium]